ncbi:MAG: butyrate kinase [Prevotella sp.]|jgi:butyrate kinase
MKILVVNPGSTSTKMAVYEDLTPIYSTNIHHSNEQLAQYDDVHDQYDFRRELVLEELRKHDIPVAFDAVIGRGGIGKPVSGGAYDINEQMIHDNLTAMYHHACNLGCKIAYDIAQTIPGCRALVAEPGVVDEMTPVAHITGRPEMKRSSVWHALNQRAVAKHFAKDIGRTYEELNLIICHIGGGISIAAHDHGKAVDVNNAINGYGPFSTERAGVLPSSEVIRMCFSGKYTEHQLLKMITGQGGVVAHLGTNDMREVMRRIDSGDDYARLVLEAMVYNISKWICALGATFCGRVDAILITGGVAQSEKIVDMIRRRVEFLAPVHCYPGENEMGALAEAALAVLQGNMKAQEYK